MFDKENTRKTILDTILQNNLELENYQMNPLIRIQISSSDDEMNFTFEE